MWDVEEYTHASGVLTTGDQMITSPSMLPLQLVSHATRHTSHVTRHTSHITRHTSHVTHDMSHVTRHISHVIRHTSHVTRHTPHVTRHTPHVTRHTSPAKHSATLDRGETRCSSIMAMQDMTGHLIQTRYSTQENGSDVCFTPSKPFCTQAAGHAITVPSIPAEAKEPSSPATRDEGFNFC